MTKLVLVESAAKVKTIQSILDQAYGTKEFKVAATLGHIRDLPSDKLGVDVQHDFTPRYVLQPNKRKTVAYLRKLLKNAKALYLASDPDREGEAIAWHCVEVLKPKCPVFRVTFNAITKDAVTSAFTTARQIDLHLVKAQEARRILDRLVGFKVSPALWDALDKRQLSAGRVQSAALRIIVERQHEIDNFTPQHYWQLHADFESTNGIFRAKLVQWQDQPVGIETFPDKSSVEQAISALQHTTFTLSKVASHKRYRQPNPPFVTSTLQQAASSHLNLSPNKTMKLAQQLYEMGAITYMRTDSPTVSPEAIQQARQWINEQFDEAYAPEKLRQYKAKSNAQEGHECIRATDIARTEVADQNLKPLYKLIRDRFLASQMVAAQYLDTSVTITGKNAVFLAQSNDLHFDGFLRVYAYSDDDNDSDEDITELPLLVEGERLQAQDFISSQHNTRPPKRYTEASLIQALERNGIGRPSTFASMVTTIQKRGYVTRNKKQLTPTELGSDVMAYLLDNFAALFDITFTARMESLLDAVAIGNVSAEKFLAAFWQDFSPLLDSIPVPQKAPPQKLDMACPDCGAQLVIRDGKHGKFIGCSEFPTCRYSRNFEEDSA